MFSSIIETIERTDAAGNVVVAANFTILSVALCTLASIVLGFVIARAYMVKSNYSKNFIMSLVILPALVQSVIMLVNGNLGTGIAVMGAFSLVKFRSIPGTSKEICAVFFSMAIGLATGMGCLLFAALLTVVLSALIIVLSVVDFGNKDYVRELRISIPEDLDYTSIFDDLFDKYMKETSLDRVKTTGMGSIFELRYSIVWKDESKQKECIDEIRCRNGNLPIVCGRVLTGKESL